MKQEKVYYSDLFKKIANKQKSMLNSSMAEEKITYVQSLVILYLLDMQKHFGTECKVSQKDVEKYLSLKGSTVTYIINRMEENGYIVRERSKKDSRINHLFTTKKGEEAIADFFEILFDLENLMTKDMSNVEKVQLKTLLQKVLINLEEKD